MNKLKLAIVGCGSFANITAIIARLNRKISLHMCYDINKETAEKFGKIHKVKYIASSLDEVLGSEVDAIYLPVPHYLHYDYIKRALLSGKHVFTEKPLCLTLDETKKVISLAKEKKLILSANFHNRYAKQVQKAKAKIKNKSIGDIVMVTIAIPWARNEKYINHNNWHGRKKLSGGGTLITQGIHALDIGLWCIDSSPVTIYGNSKNLKFMDIETEDTFSLNISFKNQATVQLFSTMALKQEKKAILKFYGTNGNLTLKLPSALGLLVAVYKSLNDFSNSIITRILPQNYCENFLPITEIVELAYLSAEKKELINL